MTTTPSGVTPTPSNVVVNDSCCAARWSIPVALVVIAAVGGAIAVWRLYSSMGPLSLMCLIPVPVGIALMVFALWKSRVSETAAPDPLSTQQTASSTLEGSVTVNRVIASVTSDDRIFQLAVIDQQVIMGDEETTPTENNVIIMYFPREEELSRVKARPLVVIFEKNGQACVLPRDEIPTSIKCEYNGSGYLSLLYGTGSEEERYQLAKASSLSYSNHKIVQAYPVSENKIPTLSSKIPLSDAEDKIHIFQVKEGEIEGYPDRFVFLEGKIPQTLHTFQPGLDTPRIFLFKNDEGGFSLMPRADLPSKIEQTTTHLTLTYNDQTMSYERGWEDWGLYGQRFVHWINKK